MLNVLFDKTMDWQTTVSRHKKRLTVTCSQQWFYNIITTTECLQNDKKREISEIEHTSVRPTSRDTRRTTLSWQYHRQHFILCFRKIVTPFTFAITFVNVKANSTAI